MAREQDESMQDEAEEGKKPLVQKEREPALEPGTAGAHEDLTSLTALGALIASREGGGMIPTGQKEVGEDQEIIHTLQLTTDSSRRTT